jgi:hypothetical protein
MNESEAKQKLRRQARDDLRGGPKRNAVKGLTQACDMLDDQREGLAGEVYCAELARLRSRQQEFGGADGN